MKKNAILMLLCILCNSGFSQNNYYDSGCDTGEYDKIQSEISTKELDQREPYILKRGNSLVYYSYKSKFSRLGVRNQDYSQPFQGFLDGPQDFFTLEVTPANIIIHFIQDEQADCGFDSKGNPVAPEGFRTKIGKKGQTKQEFCSFYFKDIKFKTATTTNILVFQTPRIEIIGGGISSDPKSIRNMALTSGETLFWSNPIIGKNRVTKRLVAASDPYAMWRVYSDEKIVISFNAMAKANGMTKEELIWTLYYTDLYNVQAELFTGLSIGEFDNAIIKQLLSRTFGLKAKKAQGKAFVNKKYAQLREKIKSECERDLVSIEDTINMLESKPMEYFKGEWDMATVSRYKKRLAEIVEFMGNNPKTDNLIGRNEKLYLLTNFKYKGQPKNSSEVIKSIEKLSGLDIKQSTENEDEYLRLLYLVNKYAYNINYGEIKSLNYRYIHANMVRGSKPKEMAEIIVMLGDIIMGQSKYKPKDDIKSIKEYIEYMEPASGKRENTMMYKTLYDMYIWNKMDKQAAKLWNDKLSYYDPDKSIMKEIQEGKRQIMTGMTERQKGNENVIGMVYEKVDEMPSFPGGNGAMNEYLLKNIKYPIVAEENGIQGVVIVEAVINSLLNFRFNFAA